MQTDDTSGYFQGHHRQSTACLNHSTEILRSQMPIIQKIRDDYRNRSTHSEAVSIVDARDCVEYVITLSRKLGVLLDQYRF